MTDCRLRVGVIGLGAFGESHLRVYRGLPHVEVVAVASRSAERARELAGRYSVPRWYEGYEGLIADPAVEAVSVTTAEADHRAPTIAAIEAGKPVLVEKPLATTIADVLAMAEAARRSSAFLMPGHILRFEPKYTALKAAVAAGDLGRLTALSARRNRPRSLVTTHGRVHPALVSAIHDIDVMLWLTNERVRSVRAHHRLADRPGEAHGLWALLEFEGGVVATLETAWMAPDEAGFTDDAFDAVGTAGSARIQFDVPGLRVWNAGGMRAPDVSYEPWLHGGVAGALKEELSAFATCALSGIPPTILTPEDGVAAVIVALAAISSAEQNEEVAVWWP